MEISSSNLSFRIALIAINHLRPHEEVIDSLVESIADGIRVQGIVRDPLIIDQDKHVILDGMHRYGSLKSLKCRFAPCCLVNYDSPLIKVGSWFRLFNVQETETLAENLLNQHNLKYTKQKTDLEHLTFNSQTIILTGNGIQYSLPQSSNSSEFARTAVMLERSLVKKGHHVDYLSETVAIQMLRAGGAYFVILVPIFSKQQIRELGIRGFLLPQKVTRHVMPSRPLRIDIPLALLTDPATSLEEANRRLGEALSTRHVDRKPPGSVVDGRRYEEELLVFAA